jgi:hypothetical protein
MTKQDRKRIQRELSYIIEDARRVKKALASGNDDDIAMLALSTIEDTLQMIRLDMPKSGRVS